MPVTLRLAEAIADAILGKLETGLATRVATINSADSEGITIAAPSIFFVGSWGPVAPAAPAILVTELGTGAEKFGEEGPHSFIYKTEILVGVFDLDIDPQQLARKLWRQARAVIEVLWDDPPAEMAGSTQPFPVSRLHPTRTVPGPVFNPSDSESRWSGVYGVVFDCWQFNG